MNYKKVSKASLSYNSSSKAQAGNKRKLGDRDGYLVAKIAELEAQLANRDRVIAQKKNELAKKDKTIAQKDIEIAQNQAISRLKEMILGIYYSRSSNIKTEIGKLIKAIDVSTYL